MSNLIRPQTSPHSRIRTSVALSSLVIFAAVSLASAQVRVMPGEIKDNRTTGQFFASLEVELRVVGDLLADAKALRVLVDSAVDESGRNLINPEESDEPEFSDLSDHRGPSVTIKLRNPARQAMTIREIGGSVELYVPGRDAASVVTVANLMRAAGKPVTSPSLRAAGAEVTIWNREQFEARKKAEEEKLKKAQEQSEAGELGEALGEAFAKLFGGLFGSFAEMGEHGIALRVQDPQGKIAAIEIQNARGVSISGSRMSLGGREDQTRIYDFSEPLPAGAQLRIYVLTPRSTVKTPFKARDIPLP